MGEKENDSLVNLCRRLGRLALHDRSTYESFIGRAVNVKALTQDAVHGLYSQFSRTSVTDYFIRSSLSLHDVRSDRETQGFVNLSHFYFYLTLQLTKDLILFAGKLLASHCVTASGG